MIIFSQKKLSLTLSCILLSGVVYSSSYSGSDGFWYFDIGAGVSKINNLPNPALDLGVSAGYSFNDYFALEAIWNGQPSFQWNNYLLNNYNIYDLAVKGSIPFSNSFSMYGKLGYGADYSSWSGTASPSAPSVYNKDSSAWGTNALIAVGINFALSNDLGIYLENTSYIPVTTAAGSFGYANSTMLGLSYSFGRSTTITNSSSPVESDVISGVIISYQDQLKQNQLAIESSTQSTKIVPTSTPEKCNASCITLSQRLIRQADGSSYIIVMRGDTLSEYGREFGVSVNKLKALNKIVNDRIVIGQKIFIGHNSN